MHHCLNRVLLLALATLAACGGGGGDGQSVTTSTSAQSAALSTPGTATATSDGRTITLNGGDGGTKGCAGAQFGFTTSPCTVNAAINAGAGSFSFDWSYVTRDTSGPGADLFGMMVDGKAVPLSDPGGPLTQSGHRDITATTSLSFYINCTDCTDGAAQASVTSFTRK